MKNDLADPEIQTLMHRIEQYRTQYNIADTKHLDRASVEDLYKRDADFTAFDIAPPLSGYIGWDAYGKAWSQVLNKYSRIVFEFRDDLRVFRLGDVAWASVSADWYGDSKAGEKFHKEFRTTLIWVREADGAWRITHEHGSSTVTTKLAGGEVI
jgi:ketosteroid isomerase-like protein